MLWMENRPHKSYTHNCTWLPKRRDIKPSQLKQLSQDQHLSRREKVFQPRDNRGNFHSCLQVKNTYRIPGKPEVWTKANTTHGLNANHQSLNQSFSGYTGCWKISQEGFMENSFSESWKVETLWVLYLKVSLAEYRIIASLFLSRLSLTYSSIISGVKHCYGCQSDFLSFENDLVFLPGCPKTFFFLYGKL